MSNTSSSGEIRQLTPAIGGAEIVDLDHTPLSMEVLVVPRQKWLERKVLFPPDQKPAPALAAYGVPFAVFWGGLRLMRRMAAA
jgi:hypothetical protein